MIVQIVGISNQKLNVLVAIICEELLKPVLIVRQVKKALLITIGKAEKPAIKPVT